MTRFLLTILTLSITLYAYSIDYVYTTGYGIKSAWNNDDIIGIYPENGRQTRFNLQEICTSNSHQAQFYGNGIRLMNSKKYFSLSPYNRGYYLNDDISTALPLDFSPLTQSSNSSLTHIKSADLMVADVTTTTENTATFTYAHLTTVLRLSVNVPEDATFTQATLTTDKGSFLTTGTLNLETRTITTGTSSAELPLLLNSISMKRGNQLTVYFITLATNLTGGNITATFTASNGDVYSCSFAGRNYEAGKMYNIERTIVPAVSGAKARTAIPMEEQASLPPALAQTRAAGVVTYPTCVIPDFLLANSDISNTPLPPVRGDVNADGVVDEKDIQATHSYILGNKPSNFSTVAADANSDGRINVADITKMKKIIQSK